MVTTFHLLDGSVDVDSIAAADLSSFFATFEDLSEAVTSLCSNLIDDGVQRRARFVALAKKHFDQLPSTSTGSSRSSDEAEDKETLVDVIWTVDQAYELGHEAQDATKARSNLGLLVKDLEAAGLYAGDFLKQRLEVQLLQLAGLITAQTQQVWTRTEPRIKTSMLYKQQKFNLLREETEGYSKLEVELLSNMGPPHDPRTARPSEPISSIRKRAEKTVLNIKGLIGYFDLDPSRTLDIILDVFADNILYHHVFFRELLRASPWGAGMNKATSATGSSDGKAPLLPDGSFETRPSGTSSVCAQILGFKFAWYSSPEGASEIPSEKLYLLSAILLWDGFVDLPSLWPHLSPQTEEGMNKLKDKFRDDISDRVMAAKSNALSMAGMLGDEAPPSAPPPVGSRSAGSISIAGTAAANAAAAANSTSASQPAPIVPQAEPANMRVGLLRALLSIGALQPAFFILASYSWICDPYPEIADLLLRLCNHSISDYYASHASPFAAKKADVAEKQASLSQAKPRYSPAEKKIVPAPASASVITGRPIDIPKVVDKTWRESIYFFSEWKDRLPKCATSGEVLEVVSQMLKLVGVHAGRNREFMMRLLRLAKLETVVDSPARKQWEGIVRMHLIPALSLSGPNPSATMDLWEVLRNFPYTTRFSFYGEWKDRSYKRMPELRVKKAEAERDAKGLLKRLSVDNVKQFGRSLAKIAHTNPTVLFEIALQQVQSYDNLIGPVVESARYLTPFGYDVLAYSLLDALSNPEKERTKTDGTNISLWLQSLATFSGTLCKRWNIDVSFILQYILNQLREGNPKDLIVLREMISKMTGVEPVSDLSDSQVVALAGGKTLQAEALNPTTAAEKKNVTKRSSTRLKLALSDSNLVVPLLVAVAIQRQECIYGDEDAPLKYLGNLFDECQQVLFQYLDFLTSQFGAEQFSSLVPDLQDLWEKYGIDAGIAFHIVRPRLQLAIQTHDAAAKLAQQENMEKMREEIKASRAAKLGRSTLITELSATATPAASPKPEVTPAVNGVDDSTDVKMEEVDAKPSDSPAPPKVNGDSKKSPWHPALVASIQVVEQKLPESITDCLSAGFFVTFWQLSLYDVLVPMARYTSEVDRLNVIVRELDASLKATIPSYPGQVIDKSGEAEKRKTRERMLITIQALNADLKAHTETYDATRKRLQAEKTHWFLPNFKPEGGHKQKEFSMLRRQAVQHFFQQCITPRAKLSPIDASYCARLIRVLHNCGATNFPSLHVYDRIFSDDLPAIVFHCTEGEARNYSRFLHDCLSELSIWHGSETVYAKQAIGNNLPGFQRQWGGRKPNETIPEKDYLKYSEFKQITQKWHKKITDAFVTCIESKDYMCIRNSILILTKIAKFFPLFQNMGTQLEGVVAQVVATEKREDLKVLALGYSALLKKQSPTWIPFGAAPPSARTASPAVGLQQPAAPAPAVLSSLAPPSVPRVAVSPTPTPAPAAPTAPAVATSVPTGPRGTSTIPPPIPPAAPSTPSRPAGLPAKPVLEADRRRGDTAGSAPTAVSSRPSLESNRRVSDISAAAVPRASHALPARPGQEQGRRDHGSSLRAAATPGAPSPSPANSRPATPVAIRNADAMDIDEPERKPKAPSEKTTPTDKIESKEEFVKPARPPSPEVPKTTASRTVSPKAKDAPSPRAPRKDVEDAARADERRSRRDEVDKSRRRSRAGSEESSHSSHRDRRERRESERSSNRDKGDRDDRKEREHRSDRDREKERDGDRRSDRDREREKEKDKDKERSGRDKDRKDREKDRERDSERRHRGDKEKERDSSRRDSGRRDRDRERDKDKEKDREGHSRDSDRKSSSSRRDDRDKEKRDDKRDEKREERDKKDDKDRKDEKDKAQDTSASRSERSEKRNGEDKTIPEPSTTPRELKRAAESSTSISDMKDSPAKEDNHEDKRRKTEEPIIPSGPKADRKPVPPAPLSTLPPRTGSSTSIKGRAASSATLESGKSGIPGQGLRIKSAASALSALSSAQQHNARMDKQGGGSRGATPSVADVSAPTTPITAEPPKTTEAPKTQAEPEQKAKEPEPKPKEQEEPKIRGLMERLSAPGPSGSSSSSDNRRSSQEVSGSGGRRRARR